MAWDGMGWHGMGVSGVRRGYGYGYGYVEGRAGQGREDVGGSLAYFSCFIIE